MAMLSIRDLRPSQLAAAAEMADSPRGILVIGMGGGKTAATLTAFETLRSEGALDRLIVLAPPRVADLIWPSEPLKWDHLEHLGVSAPRTPKGRIQA